MSQLKGFARLTKQLETSPEPQDDLVSGRAKIAKSRDPQYKRVMILVKKDTEKKAYRKWEDIEPSKDFSDLIEKLLSIYADGSIDV